MPTSLPDADQLVADVLRRWPETTAVFLRRRMACIGCSMAPFMTLREAAHSYGLPPETLLGELVAAITAEAPVT